jgi:hypothetical protein
MHTIDDEANRGDPIGSIIRRVVELFAKHVRIDLLIVKMQIWFVEQWAKRSL